MKPINLFVCLLLGTMTFTNVFAQVSDFIPSGDSDLYYRMGGGQSIPMPVFMDQETLPLDAEADVGLGYNCGVFDPKDSIMNSLNGIKNSFLNVEQGVVTNATAAITEFPMYLLARANPDLYNLMNNALLGARKDLEISTKSCEAMQNEIAQGKNPYTDWGTIAMGNDWKYRMSLAGLSSLSGKSENDDINWVKKAVMKDNGKNGVPWIRGVSKKGGKYSGGKGQPTIRVIYDTSMAGYNVALQSHRAYDDTSPPVKTDKNAHLVDTWPNPVLAAKWIVQVVGDETITTYSSGKKASTPGIGLLPENHQLALNITQAIQKLVTSQESLTLKNLKKVSAPGVMINDAVIRAIRAQKPVTQTIITNKLGQEAATAKLIDKGLLALQLLQQGSQVPAIYANKAAQTDIQKAMKRLRQAINDFLFSVKVRKALVSKTVSDLLSKTQASQTGIAKVRAGSELEKVMQHGAVSKENGA